MAAGTTTLDQAQTASTSSDLRSGVSPQVVLSGLNKHFNPRYISPEAEEAVEALKDHRHIDDFAPDEIEKAWSQFENFYHRFKRENNGKTPIPEEMFIQLKHTALHWHDLRDREKKFAWIQDWINSSEESLEEKQYRALRRSKQVDDSLKKIAPWISWSLVSTAVLWVGQIQTLFELSLFNIFNGKLSALAGDPNAFMEQQIANQQAFSSFTDDTLGNSLYGPVIPGVAENVPIRAIRWAPLLVVFSYMGFMIRKMYKNATGEQSLYQQEQSNRLQLLQTLKNNGLLKDDIRFSKKRYNHKKGIDPRVIEQKLENATMTMDNGEKRPLPLELKKMLVEQAEQAALSDRLISKASLITTPLLILTYSLLGVGWMFPFAGNESLLTQFTGEGPKNFLNALPVALLALGFAGLAAFGFDRKKTAEFWEDRAKKLVSKAYLAEKAGLKSQFNAEAPLPMKAAAMDKAMKNPNWVHDPKLAQAITGTMKKSLPWVIGGGIAIAGLMAVGGFAPMGMFALWKTISIGFTIFGTVGYYMRIKNGRESRAKLYDALENGNLKIGGQDIKIDVPDAKGYLSYDYEKAYTTKQRIDEYGSHWDHAVGYLGVGQYNKWNQSAGTRGFDNAALA